MRGKYEGFGGNMKKVLLTIGITLVVLGVIALLWALINGYMLNHVMDGSADLYERLRNRMRISMLVGIAAELVGIVCLVLRLKK